MLCQLYSWARFLSLSYNGLRNCLRQDCSETGLRLRAVSVSYLCLRQKVVLQIQIQVLDNTKAPIKYLFLGNFHDWTKFYIHEMYFDTRKLLHYNRTQIFRLVVCYTNVNILFSNFASRHLRSLCDTRVIVLERAMTTPSHGVRWLNRFLLSKTVLRHVWDRDRKRSPVTS